MHPSDSEGVSCTNKLDNQLLVLPEKLRQRLMSFQKEGVKFAISRNGRCMIADEMGLGKTIQAISVAYFYKQEWPLLIVVPSSLKYPWIEEMEKWIPELNPDDINLIDNKVDIGRISTSKVTVLGYGLLTSDAKTLVDALHKQKFQVIVVDESHYLKSRNAARSKILVPIVQKAARAILLTGTPALGRPEELFMQIDALYPRRFGTWIDFAKKYCNAHVRFFGQRRQWDSRGASNLDELHQRLSKIMIRRMKDQVLTQLPPKIRQRIPFDLPKEGAKEATASFEEWEKLMRALDSGTTGTDNSFVEVMGLITRMYKQTATAKAGAVKDYIKMMLENEKLKFLVFAHHLTMLQACTEAVIEAKVRYIRIDGSVPSSERIHLVHQFQNDPDTRVAVLSIQAAGQFEKEKQHDIRTFFSPRAGKENKRKRPTEESPAGIPNDEDKAEMTILHQSVEEGTMTKGGSQEIADEEILEIATEPQSKRMRHLSQPMIRNSGKQKRKSWAGKASSPVSLQRSQRVSEGASLLWKKLPAVEREWNCISCTYTNSSLLPYCEVCETRRDSSSNPSKEESQQSNKATSEKEQVPEGLSQTDCLVISDTDSESDSNTRTDPEQTNEMEMEKQKPEKSQCNKSPSQNIEDETVCESDNASAPVYEGLMFCASRNTDRIYLYTKISYQRGCGAGIARAEGESVNGTTQSVASSSAMPSQTAADSQEKGYLQALDAEGNPLCLCCQLPSLQVNTAWDTRFCSQRCQEEFLVRSNQSYMRAKVFETERGVCQQCNLHAQELYQRIKDAPRVSRKDILENTWMSQLSLNQLNEMIRNPTEGLFWQVDHIRPVYGGGGQCSLDNLQTLCTVCHKERTAKQAKERSQMKKTTAASKLASDISRFFIKK
ncbi:DNA annealing helicase and endonuclease ZRANB3 [Acipenser ruthenus]|uniref:DNA annealing helicase and endonuclease ZRANB3 n=1 Tax=Acipenser ruthenus TaxID=7906 RepID=A0A444UFM4_ACIRT|nr:DNA annealing helicase and endonuclease ZRANB3 [Acipenser ruthenus]